MVQVDSGDIATATEVQRTSNNLDVVSSHDLLTSSHALAAGSHSLAAGSHSLIVGSRASASVPVDGMLHVFY